MAKEQEQRRTMREDLLDGGVRGKFYVHQNVTGLLTATPGTFLERIYKVNNISEFVVSDTISTTIHGSQGISFPNLNQLVNDERATAEELNRLYSHRLLDTLETHELALEDDKLFEEHYKKSDDCKLKKEMRGQKP